MLSNFTLLYVEDNKETVEHVKDILKDRVKELYVAYDGQEGLNAYNDKKPDIILTDINMPNLNGIEMAKQIKKIDTTQPILILTAFNENHLLHESVNIGVDGYITKPIVDIKKLLQPLNKTADRLQGYIDKKNLEHLLEVQGKTAAVGEMIGNIAHQWRQPLSIISVYASDIVAAAELGEQFNENNLLKCANDVLKQTTYLSQTIDDFRSFLISDISNKKRINLNEIIDYTKSLMESAFKNHFIECITDLDNDLYINANKSHIVQAFINICNNAKDAIVQNESEDKYFFITTKKDNDYAVISFKDSGGGIKEDIIDRIFEPYFTTKHQSMGTGIGLYITFKTITKTYQGTVEAKNVEYEYEDKKLKGAEFIVKIPLEKG